MKVLGVVTARGGSKGIEGKNIRPLKGRPLLAYTAEAALQSNLERVVLTTDCTDIAEIGRQCGLEVPFMRPAELAQDDTSSIPVLQHAVAELRRAGSEFDAVLTLQPTNPLRLASDIDGAISLLDSTGADSVISFTSVGEKHPSRMKFLQADGRVIDPPFGEEFEGKRRQDLAPLYLRDGSIYLTKTEVLMEKNSLKGGDCRAWIMPVERSCNIDEPFDFLYAEWLLGLSKEKDT